MGRMSGTPGLKLVSDSLPLAQARATDNVRINIEKKRTIAMKCTASHSVAA